MKHNILCFTDFFCHNILTIKSNGAIMEPYPLKGQTTQRGKRRENYVQSHQARRRRRRLRHQKDRERDHQGVRRQTAAVLRERHRLPRAESDRGLRAEGQRGPHRRRRHSGQRGSRPFGGGVCGRREGVHPLPQTARKDPQHEVAPARLQKTRGQLCKGDRLAREGKFHRHLFGRRADPLQQRGDHGELLAFGDL